MTILSKMIKYQDAIVYKLTSSQTDKTYYGSTTKTLKHRLSKHKNDYKRWLQGKYNYITSFEIIKYDDCEIHEIERLSCNHKNELLAREGYHITNNDCVNKVRPDATVGKTRKEYKEQYDEQYRKDNHEKINAKHICACGSGYTHVNKSHHLKTPKHKKGLLKNISEWIITESNKLKSDKLELRDIMIKYL